MNNSFEKLFHRESVFAERLIHLITSPRNSSDDGCSHESLPNLANVYTLGTIDDTSLFDDPTSKELVTLHSLETVHGIKQTLATVSHIRPRPIGVDGQWC